MGNDIVAKLHNISPLIFLFKKVSTLTKPRRDPWEESLALLVTCKEQQQHTVEEDET